MRRFRWLVGACRELGMVKLDRLVNVLGGYGVRLCSCPVPRTAELRSVVMFDPTDARVVAGDVFLAVGVESVAEAVGAAVAAHASVVLVRSGVDVEHQMGRTTVSR